MKNTRLKILSVAGIYVILLGLGQATNQTWTIAISPAHPDGSWSCSLKPNESATLTFDVAPAGVANGVNYILKSGPFFSTTSTCPCFVWTGSGSSYWIVNTAGTSAMASVTASNVWEPKTMSGTGTGTGAGRRPPNINGHATGSAQSQPGDYWNEAQVHLKPVGVPPVQVDAWKSPRDPAPSTWSITRGQATVSGGGASATVTGTNASDSEGGTVVKSVWDDYPSKSDTEALTFVAVMSIEANPAVVCVGNSNIIYTVTTQPEGHSDLVTYAPADTSTPGIKPVVATCGTSSAICTVKVCKVETVTFATIPTNRTRKKVGVGEQVTLTLHPTSLSPVAWSLSGNGTISATTGNPVTFTAHDRASIASVTATYAGTPCTVSFTVIEPGGAIIEQEPGTGIWHVRGWPSVGFMGRAYILPADVSFNNIEVQEGSVDAVATGYFAYQNGWEHEEGIWVPVGDVVAGKGSKEDAMDEIKGFSDNHKPYEEGTFTWSIPWAFRVGTGAPKVFAFIDYVKTIDATGRLTVSKGGTTNSAALNDPFSDY